MEEQATEPQLTEPQARPQASPHASTFPMIKDIRAYEQDLPTVLDERTVKECRRTDFLTPDEEMWYQLMYEKLLVEFGLKKL